MRARWVVVATVLLGAVVAGGAETAAKWPGVWWEAETAQGRLGEIGNRPEASGGKYTLLDQDLQEVIVPLVLDKPMDRPRLFLRYNWHVPGSMPLRLLIAPASAKDSKDAGATVLLDFRLASHAGGARDYRWAFFPLQRLEAGSYKLILKPHGMNGAQQKTYLDMLGLVDRGTDARWLPPSQVSEGQFVGSGSIGTGVQVESVDVKLPIRLVMGDEVLGESAKPLVLSVGIANLVSEPVEADLAAVFVDASGRSVRTPGPRVRLTADEKQTVEMDVRPPGYGWYRVGVTTGAGTEPGVASLSLGVLRRPAEGVKPESLFGLNMFHSDGDLLAARMLGVKWRRGIPYPLDPGHIAPEPGKWAEDSRYEPARQAIGRWRDAGILTLGVVNYNTPWNTAPDADGKPMQTHNNRPKDLAMQAEIEYRLFKGLRKDVTYWEIWNEPWVNGCTWRTGTAQDYREMSRLIWEKVKPDMPEIMLIGGGSTSYQRDILFAPGNADIGYADGCSTHPYNSPDRTMPSSAAVEAVLLKRHSKSGGVAGIWATEVGTPLYNFEDHPEAERPFISARAVAPLYMLNRIGAGDTPIRVFYYASHYGTGQDGFNLWTGVNPEPGAVAYSAMTHFLEDGRLQGDLFASSTAMWAPHLVKPDGSSVVAFWAEDGFSGRMLLPAGVFEAFDYLGAPTGKVVGNKLVLDFVRWGTIYLVSKRPADEVRAAVAGAGFEKFKSLRINPRSFTAPLETRPPLRVKVQNLLPRTVDAEVVLATPAEIELAEPKQAVTGLKSGEIRFLEFAVKSARPSAINRYRIDYTARVGGQTQTGSQVVQAAFATFGTPTVDGQLDDWKDLTPVTMLSRGGKDYTEAALDPSKAAAILAQKQPTGTVAYRLWTRWDEANFYVAAEVPDEKLALKPPFATKPEAFAFLADNLQMAFDCLEPNPDDFFVNHPGREKYLGSEVDYEFSAAAAREAEGKPLIPELHRLKAPGTNYQTRYETNVPTNPPLGPMGNVKVAIVHDAGANLLRYELAIPWGDIKELGDALKPLRPGQSHRTRFAFGVIDDGGRGRTYWTQEAGDLQSGAYGFSPTWLGGSTRAGGRILSRRRLPPTPTR
jgi:hypothetical protein